MEVGRLRIFGINLTIMFAAVIFWAGFGQSQFASAAKITYKHGKNAQPFRIWITGTIKKGDGARFLKITEEQYFRSGYQGKPVVYLNSRGGSVHEALKIGILIRTFGMQTYIDHRKVCYSACSMIFVAGYDLFNEIPNRVKSRSGRLGFHRPHDRVKGRIIDSLKVEESEWLRQYLDTMNAGNNLFQLTIKTSPKRIRIIKNRELATMGAYALKDRRGRLRMVPPAEFVPLPVRRDGIENNNKIPRSFWSFDP